MKKFDLLLIVLCVLVMGGVTSAAPTPPVLTVGTENSPWVLAYTDPNDLLHTHLASMTSTGNFGLWGFGATAASLNNRIMGWYTGWAADFASWQANSDVTYYFDPNDPNDPNLPNYGYDITKITTYAGSSGNGHDDQRYSIYYSVVGTANWYLYDTLSWTPHYPDLPNDGAYTSVMNKAEWTVALQNVDALKFVAPDVAMENGYVTLCEIDVIGTPSTELVNPLVVDAGPDQTGYLAGGFVDVSLNGTVTSYIPYTVQWSVVSGPSGVADVSGYGHNGILPNGATMDPAGGRFGGALHFDGSTQYMTHNYAVPVPRTTFSIVHWLKPEDLTKPGSVAYYEKGGTGLFNGYNDANPVLEMHTGLAIPSVLSDCGLYPQTCGQTSAFFFEYQDGMNAAVPNQPGGTEVRLCGGQPVAGQWSHVAVTVNLGGFMKMYVNGVLVHSVDVSTMHWNNIPSDFRSLGAVGNLYGPRMWQGSMDEVAVYNQELSQAEIQNIMNNGVTMSPQAYWPMDALGTVTFTPAAADTEDVVARIVADGTYVLQLTANDGNLTRSGTTTVTVYRDACAYAQVQPGFAWNVSDANHDCQVTLEDLGILAKNWLECYHPDCP